LSNPLPAARCCEAIRFRLLDWLYVMETVDRSHQPLDCGGRNMKRSRRVVLTMMGTAAAGAVSMGFVPRSGCGPGLTTVPGIDGKRYCRATYGGFGGAPHRLHGHGLSHGHAHGGG
jgi:hypothetical protein